MIVGQDVFIVASYSVAWGGLLVYGVLLWVRRRCAVRQGALHAAQRAEQEASG